MSTVSPNNKSFLLQTLCESNYRKLLRLIPNLRDLDNCSTGHALGKPDLYITLIEKGPYTMTLELSHCFGHDLDPFFEPAIKLRVYFDVQSAEVLRDHERPMVNHAFDQPVSAKKVMDYKWELNYFLEKWLNHCLKNDYKFQNNEPFKNSFSTHH
jgi:uncharacterized protein YqiB (DUF1249 family)